jgi:hypothetical protein
MLEITFNDLVRSLFVGVIINILAKNKLKFQISLLYSNCSLPFRTKFHH